MSDPRPQAKATRRPARARLASECWRAIYAVDRYLVRHPTLDRDARRRLLTLSAHLATVARELDAMPADAPLTRKGLRTPSEGGSKGHKGARS
jgi:hypothetical protein